MVNILRGCQGQLAFFHLSPLNIVIITNNEIWILIQNVAHHKFIDFDSKY